MTAVAKKVAAKKVAKIVLVAKTCPSKPGTIRAKRWALLKTGMTVVAAKAAGIPAVFLKKMAKKGALKIAA